MYPKYIPKMLTQKAFLKNITKIWINEFIIKSSNFYYCGRLGASTSSNTILNF